MSSRRIQCRSALIASIVAMAALLIAAGCSSGESPTAVETAEPAASAPAPTPSPSAAVPEPEPAQAPETTTPASSTAPIDAVERLQAVVDAAAVGEIPGVILDVDAPELGVSWNGASGVFSRDGGQELSAEHGFRTASITKMVTAATVLRLVEEGALSFEDPISKYLPRKLVKRVHVLDGASRGAKITIHQLLGHTSGVFDYVTEDSFVDTVFANPTDPWTPRELINYALETGEPYFAPGEGYRYSDTGYVLLGLIIEKVTDSPLHEVYR
ncbi:MAG: serine hydrolase domain-containing protein, partial [Gaiellaceae bacterium]